MEASAALKDWCDHIVNIRTEQVGTKTLRLLQTIGTESYEAGSRGNVIPHGMKWGDKAKENYLAFRKLFT